MNTTHRLTQLRHVMGQAAGGPLSAVLLTDRLNRRYISGFSGSAGWAVVTPKEALLLVDFRYVEQAARQAPAFEVLQCEKQIDTLVELASSLGLSRIGFENGHMTVKQFESLRDRLPNVEWVPIDSMVELLRAVKDAAELKYMQEAVAMADRTFAHILGFLRPGVTEKEVALEIEIHLRRQGSEGVAFPPIVASGANGALPHATPTDKPLATGELVTLDFGAVCQGYHSDITRTVAIGQPDARQKEIYQLVLQAQAVGLGAVRPGRSGREVDAEAREVIARAGYGDRFGHGLGHGIGLAVHEEPPRLSKHSEWHLSPGMVCSVEPGVYVPGWGGVRIEDLVVVEPDGCRVLTGFTKELIVIG